MMRQRWHLIAHERMSACEHAPSRRQQGARASQDGLLDGKLPLKRLFNLRSREGSDANKGTDQAEASTWGTDCRRLNC